MKPAKASAVLCPWYFSTCEQGKKTAGKGKKGQGSTSTGMYLWLLHLFHWNAAFVGVQVFHLGTLHFVKNIMNQRIRCAGALINLSLEQITIILVGENNVLRQENLHKTSTQLCDTY